MDATSSAAKRERAGTNRMRFRRAQFERGEVRAPDREREPEPEPEPQLPAHGDIVVTRELDAEIPQSPSSPRIKPLEEMSVQDMISATLSAVENIDSMTNVESFDSFVQVDKAEIREKLHRAESISLRDSEERFVQQAFDDMIEAGTITPEQIDQLVHEVVQGTKCGVLNARRILLDHGMDVIQSIQYYISKVGASALLTTAAGGVIMHTAVAQAELEREQRRNFEPTEPGKLLCIAAAKGDVKLMERLLDDEGVSPNTRDPIGGYPALHYAAEFNHVPAVQLLLRRGVDIEAKDDWGQMTAYTWGAVSGSGDAVDCLLRAGCRMEARDVIGRTGQDFARVRQHEGVKAAIEVEFSTRRFRALNRHYSTMIRQPETYPALRDPTIVVPTIAQEEAQRQRNQVAETLAKMLATAGPLGTVRDRAVAAGQEHTLDQNWKFAPKPPNSTAPDQRRTSGPLIDTPVAPKGSQRGGSWASNASIVSSTNSSSHSGVGVAVGGRLPRAGSAV